MATVKERFGALHVLHNSVVGSTLADGQVTEVDDSECWRCMTVDVFSMFLGSKYGIPLIMEAGGGSVINMTANLVLTGLAGRDCYAGAKGAVAAMINSMAVEYDRHKIRVNARSFANVDQTQACAA
ncbi:MAG: hypothetical protein CMM47_04510 [Rhodospirillaceae bacterium]|nr:hypothetical protein [Rhodospirillaceae bacterium]